MGEKPESNIKGLIKEVFYVDKDEFYDAIGASGEDREDMDEALSNSCVSFGANYMTLFDVEVAKQIWEDYLTEEGIQLLDELMEAGVPLAVEC